MFDILIAEGIVVRKSILVNMYFYLEIPGNIQMKGT
ncbi:predicted protein [Botrytis cinerea T4]|uniref:Uncharacterized protein n=1 Tax=Botryotinia fuckeliana (strain T4) TaxID=999810 RepID=G2YVB7_BOTF4|nr:predicted protein [Botrytis cinerea T4]